MKFKALLALQDICMLNVTLECKYKTKTSEKINAITTLHCFNATINTKLITWFTLGGGVTYSPGKFTQDLKGIGRHC